MRFGSVLALTVGCVLLAVNARSDQYDLAIRNVRTVSAPTPLANLVYQPLKPGTTVYFAFDVMNVGAGPVPSTPVLIEVESPGFYDAGRIALGDLAPGGSKTLYTSVPWTPGPGWYDMIFTVNGRGELRDEANRTNNLTGFPVVVGDGARGTPFLVIEKLVMKVGGNIVTTAAPGDQVSFEFDVVNRGTAPNAAVGDYRISVYVGQEVVGGSYQQLTPVINPGATIRVRTFRPEISASGGQWTAREGTHEVHAGTGYFDATFHPHAAVATTALVVAERGGFRVRYFRNCVGAVCLSSQRFRYMSADYFSESLQFIANGFRSEAVDHQWGEGGPAEIAPRVDDFAAIWDGFLKIPTAGAYTFYLTSDDASAMTIDHDPLKVIRNLGPHPAATRQITVPLTAGWHPVVVRFSEYSGTASVKLEYSGPGIARQVVPRTVMAPRLFNGIEEVYASPDPTLLLPGLCDDGTSWYKAAAGFAQLLPTTALGAEIFYSTYPHMQRPGQVFVRSNESEINESWAFDAANPTRTALPFGDVYALTFTCETCRSWWGIDDAKNVSIERKAYQLKKMIDAVKLVTGSRRVNLLGHSMGGLILRAYLNGMAASEQGVAEPYGNDVLVGTTLGTPHDGSYMAAIKYSWSPFARCQTMSSLNKDQLTPGSTFLRTLNAPARQLRTGRTGPFVMAIVQDFEYAGVVHDGDGIVHGNSQDMNLTLFNAVPVPINRSSTTECAAFAQADAVWPALPQYYATCTLPVWKPNDVTRPCDFGGWPNSSILGPYVHSCEPQDSILPWWLVGTSLYFQRPLDSSARAVY